MTATRILLALFCFAAVSTANAQSSADDQIFEQCDFMPGTPNKCKLTGGTGKFEGLQADIIITAASVKTNYDGIALIIGHKKGTYKIVKTN
jgi:hypothetical protein